jgi:microcystin-dependent protein
MCSEEAIRMKRLIYSASLLVLVTCISPRPAVAQAYEPYLGEIQTFAFNFCPVGWLPLDGQLLPINQNQALFSLIGTIYGGDGVTTFALPKWGSIFTANGGALTPCIAVQGVFPSRN